MSSVAYVQEAELESLLTENKLVVLDCTATWCGPCKMVSPSMDKLSAEYEGTAKVVKLDVDDNRNVAKQLGIRSIPTVIFFKDGEQVETIVGVVPYEKFSTVLSGMVSSTL